MSKLESPAGLAVVAEVESHFSSLVSLLNATHTAGHDTVVQLDPTDALTLKTITKSQLVAFGDRYAASHPGATI